MSACLNNQACCVFENFKFEGYIHTLCFPSGDRARRSPRKLPTAMKEERKKWAMPKFLPHKYDVKLINEDKVNILFSKMKRCSKIFFASLTYDLVLSCNS